MVVYDMCVQLCTERSGRSGVSTVTLERYVDTRGLDATNEDNTAPEDEVDFMHGFTAVYAISSGIQRAR